jgi:hypothetical protein
MFQTNDVEKIKTHIFCLTTFFFFLSKIAPVYEIIWKKYGRTRQATDDNTAHAHCMPNNKGYKHTFGIWHLLLSTATMFARKRPNVNVRRTLPVLHIIPGCLVVLLIHHGVTLRVDVTVNNRLCVCNGFMPQFVETPSSNLQCVWTANKFMKCVTIY